MASIAITSSGVRIGRGCHRVALYFIQHIEQNQPGSVEILDLQP